MEHRGQLGLSPADPAGDSWLFITSNLRISRSPSRPLPDDLVGVFAKVTVSSPAVVALRSLARHWPENPTAPLTLSGPVGDLGVPSPLLSAAAWIAMGFRALFNRPETTILLRGLNPVEPYWERVLDYGLDGNLQAVMDEYLHVLVESVGLEGAKNAAALELAVPQPSRGRQGDGMSRFNATDHVLLDGGLGDVDADLAQLANDPLRRFALEDLQCGGRAREQHRAIPLRGSRSEPSGSKLSGAG